MRPLPNSFLPSCLLLSFCLLAPIFVKAETATELQTKIDQRNRDISGLEAQIKEYQKQIDELGGQASSLSATIKSLDLSRKQLETKIAVTQDQISAKNYEIQKLGSEIDLKKDNIEDDQRIIRQTFVSLQQTDDRSVPELLLGNESIAQTLGSLDFLENLQKNLYGRISSLNKDKTILESNRQRSEKAKAELLNLNKQLGDQRAIVLSTVSEKNALLKQTNQSESAYRKMLATKKAEEASLQQEIENYESQLHLLINPSQIPHTGSGILAWPLAKITITQYFGNTSFSTANPQIYNGKGHTGVDFAASIGTPIKAALDGVVVGVANTDLYPGCYSYGKWIMVKHPNGLSTLYAHMSLQSVSVGQEVEKGQLLGYSGNTGYTTGPHLHFGVYASAGVVIKKFTGSSHCQGATIPIADFSAYLNPLSYL